MARLLIGTSGWVYGGWKARFYPPALPDAQRLGFYATRLSTTEVNYSFYHVPSRETYRKWRLQVPGDFVFAVKANRAITHVARLHNVEQAWADFVKGAAELRRQLGPILIQLPPSFPENRLRLQAFLDLVSISPIAVRLAFEFRHPSWFTNETYRLLARYHAALCIADGVRHPRINEVTSAFAYLRFHGRAPLEAPFYTDEELEQEARFIEGLVRQGIDTYAYFNNDALGHAAMNAARLTELLRDICDAA
jgi:uncharacterized protein YecE (DUF72 family)